MRAALVVDDEPHTASVMAELCRNEGLAVREARDGVEALQQLRSSQVFDLVLLDVNMPHLDGFGVLESLRQQPLGRPPAIIIVTAQADVDSKMLGTALGAMDFVEKPFRLHDLRHRVVRALAVVDLERRLSAAEVELQELRGRDRVTGLGVFAQLHRALEAEFAAAQAQRRPLTCLLLSDEQYYTTLDRSGPLGGAARLQRVAEVLGRHVRPRDAVFRVDAAEFVLLLPETGADAVAEVVAKVRRALVEVPGVRDEHWRVAVAALPHPEIGQAAALYRAANIALARARSRGVSQLTYFDRF